MENTAKLHETQLTIYGNDERNNVDNFITMMSLLMTVTMTVEYLVSIKWYHGLVVQ